MERSALAEIRFSRCSVVRPRLPGDVSIRESYSRSQCRLRLLAIAALGQHHPRGVHLASARRAKCHTYQSTLLPPAPSRVVVDRCSWLAVRVVLLFLILCCPVVLGRFFSPTHIPPNTSYTTLRTRPWPPDTPSLLCQHWDTALLCYTPPESSRPARLGLRLQTTRPFPNPTRTTDVIDHGTPPQPQSIKTFTTKLRR